MSINQSIYRYVKNETHGSSGRRFKSFRTIFGMRNHRGITRGNGGRSGSGGTGRGRANIQPGILLLKRRQQLLVAHHFMTRYRCGHTTHHDRIRHCRRGKRWSVMGHWRIQGRQARAVRATIRHQSSSLGNRLIWGRRDFRGAVSYHPTAEFDGNSWPTHRGSRRRGGFLHEWRFLSARDRGRPHGWRTLRRRADMSAICDDRWTWGWFSGWLRIALQFIHPSGGANSVGHGNFRGLSLRCHTKETSKSINQSITCTAPSVLLASRMHPLFSDIFKENSIETDYASQQYFRIVPPVKSDRLDVQRLWIAFMYQCSQSSNQARQITLTFLFSINCLGL